MRELKCSTNRLPSATAANICTTKDYPKKPERPKTACGYPKLIVPRIEFKGCKHSRNINQIQGTRRESETLQAHEEVNPMFAL